MQPFKAAEETHTLSLLSLSILCSVFEHLSLRRRTLHPSQTSAGDHCRKKRECLQIVPQFQMTDAHARHSKITEKQRCLFQDVLCVSLKGRNMLVFCGHGKQADGCINKACWNIWSLLCVQLFNVFKEQL